MAKPKQGSQLKKDTKAKLNIVTPARHKSRRVLDEDDDAEEEQFETPPAQGAGDCPDQPKTASGSEGGDKVALVEDKVRQLLCVTV
jgi:hypothetical protein